jgi:PDZ domain/Aspartyl protease
LQFIKNNTTLGIIIMALLMSAQVNGQGCGGGDGQSVLAGAGSGFSMDSKSGSVTIPFVMRSNHLVLSLELKGKSFAVILDTGMPMEGLILFGNEKTKILDLENAENILVGGAAGADPVPAKLATGYDVKIPGLTLSNQIIMVMQQDGERSCAFRGEEGIVGASIFNHLVVQIDYEKKLLKLTDPKKFSYSGDATIIPLIGSDKGTPKVDLTVTLNDGTTMDRQVVLDLGASHALALNTALEHKVPLPEKNVKGYLGTGVDGRLFGHIGRIQSLTLGPHTFNNVIVSFTDIASASCGPKSNGNLGQEILKRFNVTIDYTGNQMILVPNNMYLDPFKFDMTGFSLERTASGNYRVFEIIPNSPAAEAGIKINDIITKINGQTVTEISRELLTSLKQGESGKTLIIEIDRPNETIEKKLILREII